MKFRTLVTLLILSVTAFAAVKPGPDNTGPTVSADKLTASAGMTIKTDNTVIENRLITGTIIVQAANVTIRNCVIDATGVPYGINTNYLAAKNVLIEYCEIKNATSACVIGSNFTLRFCNLHDSGSDAIKPFDNFVIQNNWIHHLGTIPNSHADGIQMVMGTKGLVQYNFFDMPNGLTGYTNSQCIILNDNNGPVVDITMDSNWFNGGGFSVQIMDGVISSSLTNNLFTKNALYGPIRDNTAGTLLISDNKYEEDGSVIAIAPTVKVEVQIGTSQK